MNYKLCPECKKKSYSAISQGPWNCPYCQRDLTHLQSKPATNRQLTKLKLVNNSMLKKHLNN